MGMLQYMKREDIDGLYAASEPKASGRALGQNAYRPAWQGLYPRTRDWCGGPDLRVICLTDTCCRISDCLREIMSMTGCVPLGRHFKEMKLTYPDGVCTVYAVEGVRAENAVYAETVCSMMEHGCEPWRWIEGGEADEPCWARVMEHGCEPWRWKEGVEAGWRIDVQDRCGAVHSGLVAVAVTTSGDDGSTLCYVWPWSQDYEEPVMTFDTAVCRARLWRKFDPASLDAVVWRARLWRKTRPLVIARNGRCS